VEVNNSDLFELTLYIDSSTKLLEVSILSNDKLLSKKNSAIDFDHAEKITLYIEERLNSINKSLSDLTSIIVNIGPGSYTGIRVGLSSAKALSYGLDIPLIPVTCFDVLMANALNKGLSGPMSVLVHARASEFYIEEYDAKGNKNGKNQIVSLDSIDKRHYDKKITYLIYEIPNDIVFSLSLYEIDKDVTYISSFLKSAPTNYNPSQKIIDIHPLYIRIADYKKKSKVYF